MSVTGQLCQLQVEWEIKLTCRFMISGFRRDVDEICALLGYYTALSDSSVQTFWDNLLVPFSRVKIS
jgi:hypothetical protein